MKAWRPTPFLIASAMLHGAAAVTLLFQPENWGWALAALVLNHAAICAAGLWPRSSLLGRNLVRLPEAAARRREVAITLDDGPDPEVTPQVLAVLAAHGVKASFFCIGERAQAHPDLCREIVAAGHDIENHGQFHRNHTALSGLGGWRREVGTAQHILQSITGRPPQFFRALAGLRNPLLDPVLHSLDLRLASWSRRGYDTRCQNADEVLARLTANLSAGDILLLHDGNSARTAAGIPVVLDVLPRLLAALADRNLTPVKLESACKPN